MFSISFAIASAQRVFQFFLSSFSASFIELGTSIPNLCVRLRYLGFLFRTKDMMQSCFFNTCITHQLNAGSWLIPLSCAYSAVSIGCGSFIFARFYQEVEQSINWQQSCQPNIERPSYVCVCGHMHKLPSDWLSHNWRN